MKDSSNSLRDRIVELRRVPAAELQANPRNWRVHPDRQRAVMEGVLAEIGYADALIARQLADGSLELLDGHLRKETTPDAQVPVLIVDLNDEEAAKFLAVHDPLSAMAEADHQAIARLLEQVQTENEAIHSLLAELETTKEPTVPSDGRSDSNVEPEIPELFQLLVECANEEVQRELYEEFYSRGYKCRVMVL